MKVKKIVVVLISVFLIVNNFVPSMEVFAMQQQAKEEKVQAIFTQEYDETYNVTRINVNVTPKKPCEIIGISMQDNLVNGSEASFLVSKNGDYTFTVHFKEQQVNNEDSDVIEPKEETMEFVEHVTNIQEKTDTSNEEKNIEDKPTKDNTNSPVEQQKKEEEQNDSKDKEIAEDETKEKALKKNSKKRMNSKATLTAEGTTDTKYFIFGKPNTITSYVSVEGAPKDIVIPRTYIDDNDVEQEILYLDTNAFAGQQLTSVLLNDNLKSIGDRAFYNNQNLQEIIIPDSVETLGTSAFQSCIGLKNVKIGSGLTAISAYAFQGCTSLESLHIPSNVKTLMTYSFQLCTSLKTMSADYGLEKIERWAFGNSGIQDIELPESLKVIEDYSFYYCVFEKFIIPDSVTGYLNLQTIFGDPYNVPIKDLTIGSGVTAINKFSYSNKVIYRVPSKEVNELNGLSTPSNNVYWKSNDKSCFYENDGIIYGFKQLDHESHQTCMQHGDHTYANIDQSLFVNKLTKINSGAFSQNSKITSVTLPDTIEVIGNNAFYYTKNLKSINFPKSLTSIETDAFFHSAIESEVVLTDSLLSIGYRAFSQSKIKSINIPNSIETIDKYTFDSCTNLSSVTIGNHVKTIDEYAFAKSSILQIELPDSLESVNDYAFSSCTKLNEVKFGNGLQYINEYAFANSSIKQLELPDSLERINDYAFISCTKLNEVKFGNGLQYIGNAAFYGSGIKNLSIPDNVLQLGKEAFQSSRNLEKLNIGSGLTIINYGTFGGCDNLAEVTFSEGLQQIGENAFFNSTLNLKTVKFPNSLQTIEKSAFDSQSTDGEIEIVEFGSNLLTIGDMSFRNNNIKKIVLPDSVTSVGKNVFSNERNRALEDITIGSGLTTMPIDFLTNVADGIKIRIPSKYVNEVENTPWSAINAQIYWKSDDTSCYYENNGVVYGFKPLDHESHTACKQHDNHTYIDLSGNLFENPVTKIEDGAFANNTKITKAVLPDSLETLGNRAFSKCENLIEVNLNEGLKSIGANAFEFTNLSKKLIIPDSVVAIGNLAFSNTKLSDVTIGSGVNEIGNIFSQVKNVKIRIPSKEVKDLEGAPWGATSYELYWKSNDDSCFYIKNGKVYGLKPVDHERHKNCEQPSNHTHIEIPAETNGQPVTEIDDNAFAYTSQYASEIEKVSIPGSVKKIGNNAFYSLTTLTKLNLEEGTEVIGDSAFFKTSLERVTVPNSMIEIQNNAFFSNTKLKELDLGNGVKILGEKVAYNTNVARIALPDSLEVLGKSAFSNCLSLEELSIGTGLKKIDIETFYNASMLNNVTIPSNVKSIEYGAFSNCTQLKNITFSEGLEEIKDYTYGRKGAFENSAITSIKLPNSLIKIGDQSFANCKNLNSVSFGNSLKNIDDGTFLNCITLNNVVLPDNIEQIGFSSFQNCTGLQNIQISKELKNILKSAFQNADIKSLHLYEKIDYISEGAFQSCSNLIDIKVDNASFNIGKTVFKDCKNLVNADLGDNVKFIDTDAFANCVNLKNVNLGKKITNIENTAFYNTGLESLKIPNKVYLIGTDAFKDCKNLKSLIFEEGITYIGDPQLTSTPMMSGTSVNEIEIPSTVVNVNLGAFANSNPKYIYVDQLRDACAFKISQPWGASSTTKVYYRGEYIERTANVSYDETFSKATISLDLKSEIYGYIKSVKLPDGRLIDNIDQETYTLNHNVFVNGSYTFYATSSYGNTREITVVVDQLNPIQLTAQDATLDKKEVSSLNEEKIIMMTKAKGWLIKDNGIDEPITEDTVVTVKSPSIESIKEALLKNSECEITLRTEGLMYEGENKRKAEITVKITAEDVYTVEFQDYDGRSLDIQKVKKGENGVAKYVPSRKGYTFTGWDKDFTNVIEDIIITAQYKKDANKWATVKFLPGDHGTLSDRFEYEVLKGTSLSDITKPTVKAENGWKFTEWNPTFDTTTTVDNDITFTAQYKKDANKWATVKFLPGDHGTLSDRFEYEVLKGTSLSEITKPTVKAENGWKFTEWDPTFDTTAIIENDITFTAQYKKDTDKWATVKFLPGDHGTLSDRFEYEVLKGTSLSEITKPTVKAENGWKFTEWDPTFDTTAIIENDITFTAQYKKDANKWATVKFLPGDHGTLSDRFEYEVLKGTSLSDITKPTVKAENGWKFTEWDPTFDTTAIIENDITFTAQYKKDTDKWATVKFLPGDHGTLSDRFEYEVLKGTSLSEITKPIVKAESGWKFTEWDPTFDTTTTVDNDITFTAQYEQIVDKEDKPVHPKVPLDPTNPTVPSLPKNPDNPITLPFTTLPYQLGQNDLKTGAYARIVNKNKAKDSHDNTNKGKVSKIIKNNGTPLAQGNQKNWALMNLICVVISVALGIWMLLVKNTKKEVTEEQTTERRRKWLKALVAIMPIISIVAFILTEDMSLRMEMVDKWTFLMAALTLVQIAITFVGYNWKKRIKDTKEVVVR